MISLYDILIYNLDIIEHSEYISLDDNIFDNPQFVNIQSGDFNLQSTSPCINSGNPTSQDRKSVV